MIKPTEADLYKILEKISFGNREEQRALYQLIAPKIFPYCLKIKTGQEAEELLVKVFVELFDCLADHKSNAGFEDWCLQFFWEYVKREKLILKIDDDQGD